MPGENQIDIEAIENRLARFILKHPNFHIIIGLIVAAIFLGVITGYSFKHYYGWPSYQELALFFAPGITIGVATASVWNYLSLEMRHLVKSAFDQGEFDESGQEGVSLSVKLDDLASFFAFFILNVALVGVLLVLCFYLATEHYWLSHFIFLFTIYAALCLWDKQILKMCNEKKIKSPQIRLDVDQGNKFINKPTVVTVILLGLYLWIGEGNHWQMSFEPEVADKNGFESVTTALTTGVVAFHLLVGALSYLFVSFGPDPSSGE